MTEHWIGNDNARAAFWAQTSGLGLSHEQVHEGLGVESVKDYGGSIAEALETLTNYAAGLAAVKEKEVNRDLALALSDAMKDAPEAAVVAWCNFQRAPGYPTWSLTVREVGLPPELETQALRQAIKQTQNIEKLLVANGYMAVFNGRDQAGPPLGGEAAGLPSEGLVAELAQAARGVIGKAQFPVPGPLPAPATPPATAAPRTAPPPPAAPPTAPTTPAAQAQNGSMELIQAEFIKTVQPGDKVQVQFWRPNRKYAEITWSLGGERLLEIAPDLVAAGYTTAHFDAPGGNYPVPVNVYWTPSANTNQSGQPYKDIQRIEVR